MADKVVSLSDRPLSDEKALGRIQSLVGRGGLITWAPGVEERARDLGLTTNDLLVVIRDGKVTGNRKVLGIWRYVVEGWCSEGEVGYEVEIAGRLLVVRLFFDSRGKITTE